MVCSEGGDSLLDSVVCHPRRMEVLKVGMSADLVIGAPTWKTERSPACWKSRGLSVVVAKAPTGPIGEGSVKRVRALTRTGGNCRDSAASAELPALRPAEEAVVFGWCRSAESFQSRIWSGYGASLLAIGLVLSNL